MEGFVAIGDLGDLVEDGDWFADCPVVLDFDGVQVEICHWKFDELSIVFGRRMAAIDDHAGAVGYHDGMDCFADMNIRTAA